MAKSVVSSGSMNVVDPAILEQELKSLTEINKLTEAIREESAAISLEYSIQTNQLAEQIKNAKSHVREMRRVMTISTDIKHLQENIESINDRLGVDYIKQETIQKRLNQQKTLEVRLEKELSNAKDEVEKLKNKGISAAVIERSEQQKYLNAVIQAIATNKANKVVLDNINVNLEEANNLVHKTNTESRSLESILSRIARIPIIGPFLNLEKISESIKSNGLLSVIPIIKEQVKSLLTSKLGLIAMAAAAWGFLIDKITDIAKLVLELDKNITAVGNSLGIAKEAADTLVRGFYNTNEPVNNLKEVLDSTFITTTNISKSILSLQESFGVSAIFSREMVQSQILLTEQLGLSQEEAAGLQKYYYTSGVNAKNVLDTITRTNRSFISNKKLISEISKVNSEIATSYKNQVGALANAAVQAAKLGMTLDDTRKISDSLLNFESSIENELKAELLLGKQLNFEKARSLALEGKSAEAAALVVKQTGGINNLNNLNVIQRKALADSIGLSVEEMTKFAQQEEIVRRAGFDTVKNAEAMYQQLKAAGKEKEAQAILDSIAKQQNGEMVAQDMARVDINKRFEQSMLKIKDIFATMLAGPITGVLESIASLLQNTTMLKVVFLGLIGLLGTIVTLLTTAAVAAAFASGGVSAIAGAVVTGGILAAITGTAVNSGNRSIEVSELEEPIGIKDGVISPKGQLLISTPEGQMIKTSKNDYLYATPNPPSQMLGGNNRGGAADNGETIGLLRQMVALMRAGGVLNMDGIKVAEVMGRTFNSFA